MCVTYVHKYPILHALNLLFVEGLGAMKRVGLSCHIFRNMWHVESRVIFKFKIFGRNSEGTPSFSGPDFSLVIKYLCSKRLGEFCQVLTLRTSREVSTLQG